MTLPWFVARENVCLTLPEPPPSRQARLAASDQKQAGLFLLIFLSPFDGLLPENWTIHNEKILLR
jgi:hypothetical protein